MRLAKDEISIRIEGEAPLHLRPTLRAAYRLERRYGGFDKLVVAVADGNLTVIADVIRESAPHAVALPAFLDCLESMPLRHGLEAILEPMIRHVFSLAGLDPDKARGPKQE